MLYRISEDYYPKQKFNILVNNVLVQPQSYLGTPGTKEILFRAFNFIFCQLPILFRVHLTCFFLFII